MTKIFILEDSHDRIAIFEPLLEEYDVVVTETADEAIRVLREEPFDTIFMDHDLGGVPPGYYGAHTDPNSEMTGSEVARWMAESKLDRNVQVFIHSMNPEGAKSMQNILVDAGFKFVKAIPFSQIANMIEEGRFLQ